MVSDYFSLSAAKGSGAKQNREASAALSQAQVKVLKFLKDCVYSNGSMPTLREICKYMGWSAVGSAQDVIHALIEKGFLKRQAQKARGLEILNTDDFRMVPILGTAPAGKPVEAIENHSGDLPVPDFLRGPVFAVLVKGDSMKDADIQDGDMVIVKQSEQAESGEIVVARIQGEVTIKRLLRKKDEIWLMPENSRFRPQKVESEDFRILGRVIGLHRYWDRF